jgi:hypothetical protein
MPILQCYVDAETLKWLEQASSECGRKIENLAEAAIENAAIEYKVSRPRSPHETAHD